MMAKTLTIRLTDEQAKDITRVQARWQINTASKALIHSVDRVQFYADNSARLASELDESRQEIARLQQVINSARASALGLLDTVGQNNMFSKEDDSGTKPRRLALDKRV